MLNFIAMFAALGATLLSATVTTVGGVVPMVVLAPLVAIGFGTRFGGATYAISRGEWGMPWGPRVASWLCFGLAAALLGLAGSISVVAAFGAFVVLDTVGGFVKRAPKEAKPRKPLPRAKLLRTLAVAGYLGLVAAFHLLLGRYLPYGVLITWSLLALGFSAVLFLALRGPKAGEAWLRAPADHRVHERREKPIVDPQRQRAEDVVSAFRSRGDAGPFLDLVREAARTADLTQADITALETRILSSLARVGTRRDEDVAAALDEVERFLSLRTKPLETPP